MHAMVKKRKGKEPHPSPLNHTASEGHVSRARGLWSIGRVNLTGFPFKFPGLLELRRLFEYAYLSYRVLLRR